jgi:deferrochelatase/peroxidase EfeB
MAEAAMNARRPTAAAPVELDDVQGMLRFGYKHHKEACFLLLRVKNAAAACAWLARAPVTNAVTADPLPRTVLQVALSSEGLRALGIPADIIDGFSAEFIEGMSADADRSRRLGDVGPNAPSHWEWGAGVRVPHVLVILYALPGLLGEWRQSIEVQCDAGFEQMACLLASDMRDVEPFGFVDGISQPEIDWERRRPPRDQEQLAYTNLSCLGEYLLGYPNEYGLYTDRPLLDLQREGAGLLPMAENPTGKADLGRNGSYLVMRQLSQDVQGFWRFLDQQAGGDPALRQRWAEAMVGRTLRGKPLVGGKRQALTGDAAAIDLNAFTYESDPKGIRCPLGAHIRRTNPRNADLPPGSPGLVSRLKRMLGFDAGALAEDLVASTRFHRLLRRGRDYGVQLSLTQALSDTPVVGDSGLYFICLGANIGRQFEFVQNAWVMGTKFNGLRNEGDPLLGNREAGADGAPNDEFSLPRSDGADERLGGLPRFVTMRGGGYFFLPGIRALRYLAGSR